ncbi:MAG: C10 family peptidase, partial [Prolixibacteraceae bacterium]
MNRIVVLILFVWLVNPVLGQKINIEDAKKIAENFLSTENAVLIYQSKDSKGEELYYSFNFINNNGFVIVSASDKTKPILGYSRNNQFKIPNTIDSEHIEYFLKRLDVAIDSIEVDPKTIVNNRKLQKSYIQQERLKSSSLTKPIIGPLLTTQWGQDLGKYANEVGNSPAGCVATAVAQIMKYYGYPDKGYGNKTIEDGFGTHYADFENTHYQWDKMTNEASDNELISELLYHVSIALSSNYDPEGTGVSANYVMIPLRKYFAYNQDMFYFNVNENMKSYGIPEYDSLYAKNKVIEQIKSGQPVILSLGGGKGHAVVCDGYDEENEMFHINWGWNGTNDGYYDIYSLQEWTLNAILCNIKPQPNYEYTIKPFQLNKTLNPRGSYPCGQGTHQPQILADFDGDGNIDLLQKNYLYNNNQGAFGNQNKKYISHHTFQWVDYFDIADYNNDGYYDLLTTGLGGDYGSFTSDISLFNGDGSANFTEKVKLFSSDSKNATIISDKFFDFSGDGLFDIEMNYYDRINESDKKEWFINENNNYERVEKPQDLSVFDWCDVNNDGKLDAAVMELDDLHWYKSIKFYSITEFDTTVVAEYPIAPYPSWHTHHYYHFTKLLDVDNDGIFELIAENTLYDYSVELWKFNGDEYSLSYVFPTFNNLNSQIFGTKWTYKLNVIDFNADGYLDIVLIWLRGWYGYGIEYYQNNNGQGFTEISEDLFDWTNASNSAWADFNGDGYVDFTTPGTFYTNTLGDGRFHQNEKAHYPNSIEVTKTDRDLLISWDKGTDDKTPQTGLAYNLKIGRYPGKGDVVSPGKIPGTGNMQFRREKLLKNMPDGKYYVQVQTIDHSMEAGEWSPVMTSLITTSEGMEFIEKEVELEVEDIKHLTANVLNEFAPEGENNSNMFQWESSSPEVVSVNQEGEIIALKEGEVLITAVGTKNGEELKATCIVTVANDDDDDGVPNAIDECTDTPYGEAVNDKGCSQSQLDDDGDGVRNGIDECSQTPQGEAVDNKGCSQSQLDDDGDGVNNHIDECSHTPQGEAVDDKGCSQSQLDDDGDGVNNHIDECSQTPLGEEVDNKGCSQSQLDDDGDGVNNHIDECANTPQGEAVDNKG